MKVKFADGAKSNTLANYVLDFFNKDNSEELNPFEAAKEFIALYKNEINEDTLEEDLEPITLSNLQIGDATEDQLTDEQYKVYNKLNLLLHYIEGIVIDKYEEEYKGLTRMKVPPLDVYNYIGHNKLDIKESAKGYALLYED